MNIAQKMMTVPAALLVGLNGGIKADAANAARTIITEHPSQVEVVSKDGAQSLKARLGNFERKIVNNQTNEHIHGDYVCPATHKADKSDCTKSGFRAPERPQEIANNQLNEHTHGDKVCPATHKEDKSDCT